MALSDRKIPILTGINDVPSTEGGANHPNDSLLCANYNALIDDLSSEITTQARQAISATGDATYDSATGVINVVSSSGVAKTELVDNLYIDLLASVDGDGLSDTTPFNSVASLIDKLNNSFITGEVYVYINCLSDVDFGHFKITPDVQGWQGISDLYDDTIFLLPEIYIYAYNSTELITYDSIESTCPLVISHPILQDKTLIIRNSNIKFENDIELTNDGYYYIDAWLIAYNSKLTTNYGINYKAPTYLEGCKGDFEGVIFTTTRLHSHYSQLMFKNSSSVNDDVEGVEGLFVIAYNNSNITFASGTINSLSQFIVANNSTIKLLNFTSVMAQGNSVSMNISLLYTQNCTGVTHTGGFLRVDNGVVS